MTYKSLSPRQVQSMDNGHLYWVFPWKIVIFQFATLSHQSVTVGNSPFLVGDLKFVQIHQVSQNLAMRPDLVKDDFIRNKLKERR